MTNRHAHAATAAQPSTRPAPAHATVAPPHRGPAGARSSPSRDLPAWLRSRRDSMRGRRLRPCAGGTAVVLRGGSAVLIRQIQATDAPRVAGIFARLSPTSRWMRFLAAKNHLSDTELRYLTDVDHYDHEAVIALDPDGQGIGAARYIRHAHDQHAAEIAIAVVDDWHRRGLGTRLLAELSARARHAGVGRFTALTSADNEAMAGLLHTMNAAVTGRGGGTVEYQISLAPGGHDPYEREKRWPGSG